MKINKDFWPKFKINFSLDRDALVIAESEIIDEQGKTSYLVFDINTLEKIQEVEVCLIDKNIPSNFTGVPDNLYEESYAYFMETPYSISKFVSKVVSWANGNYILVPVYRDKDGHFVYYFRIYETASNTLIGHCDWTDFLTHKIMHYFYDKKYDEWFYVIVQVDEKTI